MQFCVKLVNDKNRSLVQRTKNPWNQSEELLCAVGLLAQLNLTGLMVSLSKVTGYFISFPYYGLASTDCTNAVCPPGGARKLG